MPHAPEHEPRNAMESLRGGAMLFAFGIGVLAFLIAIGHGDWFHIRPISGTAVALSLAADNRTEKRADQDRVTPPAAAAPERPLDEAL